jgi:hypothetical protein
VTISGHVEDARGLQDAHVVVGDTPVELDDDGAFSLTQTVEAGAHRIRAVAEDGVGHVSSDFTSFIAGTFGAVDAPKARAISVALGELALDAIGVAAAPHLSPDVVAPMVMAANPIADGFWGEVHTTGETHDLASIVLTPGSDEMSLTVAVPNVEVPFEARLPLGLTITGTTYVETAFIDATVAVGAADGLPVIDLDRSDVTLEGLFIDVDGLWDWVDRNLVTRALSGTIEGALRDAVQNEVPPALESALAALPTSTELELAGYRAGVEGSLSELSATGLGLRAVLDFGIRPIGGAGPVMLAAPGPLLLGTGREPRGAPAGVEGAITIDLLNHALFAAWGVGGLSYRFDEVPGLGGQPVDVGLLNIVVPIRGVPREATLAASIEAALPPVVRATATGLEMTAADLRVDLFANDVPGADEPLATISCGVRASVAPILGEDGTLGMEVESLEVNVDNLSELEGLPPAVELDALLGSLLEPMLATHGRLEGFAIPSVAGFTLGAEDLYSEEGYVVFRGQLEATE